MIVQPDAPIPATGQLKYETLGVGAETSGDDDRRHSPKKRAKKRKKQKCANITQHSFTLDVYGPLILIVYLVGFCVVYCYVEHWNFWEAMYFCVITISTVGYGDFTPGSDSMKIFTVIFIYVGIVFLACTAGHVLGRLVGRDLQLVRKDPEVKWYKSEMGQLTMGLATMALIGTIFYILNEDMSFVNGFYFTLITLSTVGYGDISLGKTSTIIFDMIFVFFGVPMLLLLLGLWGEKMVRREQQMQIDEFVDEGLSPELIKIIEDENVGKIERAEFMAYLLVHMGKVTAKDINQANLLFNKFDENNEGELDVNTVEKIMLKNSSTSNSVGLEKKPVENLLK